MTCASGAFRHGDRRQSTIGQNREACRASLTYGSHQFAEPKTFAAPYSLAASFVLREEGASRRSLRSSVSGLRLHQHQVAGGFPVGLAADF